MGRARAKAKQAKGAVKETLGQVARDPKREVEGHVEKLEGKAQDAAAAAKRRKHAK
ncbi:CsbD family protein [Streptomyces sp. NPDC008001]|uniref:CsbD family protein n=1 Tax=Streptomyces sp. NPDC008001 TaxID=3364804 RepID=UPI0036ECD349